MLHGLHRGIQQPSKFSFFSYLFPDSLLPPIYTNEWRDNRGNVTVNRLRPRPNLSVLKAIRKRIKIFFTQVSLLGFSFTCQHNYLTFSFKNVKLWWVKFPPIIRIKTPKNADRSEGMLYVIVSKSRCFTWSHKKRRVSKTIRIAMGLRYSL